MTQPQQPTPDGTPPTALPDVRVSFGLQPVPGGSLVRCTIAVASVAFTFLTAHDQAEQLAAVFRDGFAEGAAAARRAGLGLVLPGDPGMQMPVNGHNGAGPG